MLVSVDSAFWTKVVDVQTDLHTTTGANASLHCLEKALDVGLGPVWREGNSNSRSLFGMAAITQSPPAAGAGIKHCGNRVPRSSQVPHVSASESLGSP
jgi:hypothetical protein